MDKKLVFLCFYPAFAVQAQASGRGNTVQVRVVEDTGSEASFLSAYGPTAAARLRCPCRFPGGGWHNNAEGCGQSTSAYSSFNAE